MCTWVLARGTISNFYKAQLDAEKPSNLGGIIYLDNIQAVDVLQMNVNTEPRLAQATPTTDFKG